jgi:hypothetical protein
LKSVQAKNDVVTQVCPVAQSDDVEQTRWQRPSSGSLTAVS